MQLPWPKSEIIDAMIAEYRPVCSDDPGSWAIFTQVRALQRLALSERAPRGFGGGLAERLQDGRGPTSLEDALFARLARVWEALRDGRDPNVAYEEPLRGQMH
jgi:hypothetical protein